MFSSASTFALRRCLLISKQTKTPHLITPQFRGFSSVTPGSGAHGNKYHDDNEETSKNLEQRRTMHQTSHKDDNMAAAELALDQQQQQQHTTTSSTISPLANRFLVTAEVTVSKIFPAGFGWQSFSILADDAGMAADSLSFAATTGLGDALGVFGGHCLYYATKKAVTGSENINLKQEMQTGLLLGSAAFCSGTAWQPLVNVLQGADLSFNAVMAGTWIGCGTLFYAGLRIARTLLHESCEYIADATYDNAKTDASLSVAIGGATGFFVGTDAGYLPNQNFLIDHVGITETTPALMGCAIAGTSTSMGFLSAQTALNLVYPRSKCWND